MQKTIKFFLFLFLFFYFCTPAQAKEFELHSSHAILYNLDEDTILYEKNADERTAVASLTKIMTTIVAIENINNLNEKVTLTPDVFTGLIEANASVAGFQVGQQVTYMDLLMGTMLPSGADAARGLAINLAGSEKKFVTWMNQKVQELGLTNTNFVNITGLDAENHYSTVEDIATILKYALENPTFKKIYTTREYTTTNGLTLYSTLKKISEQSSADVSHILGTKTGYTGNAGLCLSSIANYNGINYLLVTTGADPKANSPLQLLDAITVYNYYANNYGYHSIVNRGETLVRIPIKYSYQEYYNITAPNNISKFLPNTFDKSKITYKYTGLKELSYKNDYQEELGQIEIIYDNEVLDIIPIYLEQKIYFNLLPFIIKTKLIYIIVLAIAILACIIYILKKKRKLATTK